MTDEPRAYTAEEARDTFLHQLATMAHYWATLEAPDGPKTPLERCNGLIHSILANISGNGMAHPAIDLVLCPHPDDKQYHIENGENYYQPGMTINDCMLNEFWHKYERKRS